MLRVASFKITEADSINRLLDQCRLAAGAHILISDGQVCIPYEDGKPPTKWQIVASDHAGPPSSTSIASDVRM
jgi:hypothetical protein